MCNRYLCVSQISAWRKYIGPRLQFGFSLLELVFVLAILVAIAAMVVPQWVQTSRMYRLRGDADRVAGLINASRMRGTARFARVKVDCGGTAGCNGAQACTVSLENYQTQTSSVTEAFSSDTQSQKVCLASEVVFAAPSTSLGVGGQNTSAPQQNLVLYFNSLGLPITSTGSYPTTYSLYLEEQASMAYMAIGINESGKTTIYSLNRNTWIPIR